MGQSSALLLLNILFFLLKSPAASYSDKLPLDSSIDGNLHSIAPSSADGLPREERAFSEKNSPGGAEPSDTDDDDEGPLGSPAEHERVGMLYSYQPERTPSQSAVSLAREKLSPEEFEEAQREVLEALNQFDKTTTTTRPPGFLKEVGVGIKNFFTAPFRATKEVFTAPSRAFSSNMGSASLTAKKLQSVAAGESGWGEIVRDWWHLITMNPNRQKQADELSRQSALEGGDAARAVMNDDGQAAKLFGDKLKEAWDAEQFQKNVTESRKSEEQLDKEFEQMLQRGN